MRLKEKLEYIVKFFILSVPAVIPFVYTGTLYLPFVSGKTYLFRFFVSLAAFFCLWLEIEKRRQNFFRKTKEIPESNVSILRNSLTAALLVFFLTQIISASFGVDPYFSFFSGFERGDGVIQYAFWIVYFLIMTSVFKKEKDWKIFFSIFILAAFLISLYSWYVYLDKNKEGIFFGKFGNFGNPAYFGAYLIFAVGFSFLLLQKRFFGSKDIFGKILVFLASFFIFTIFSLQIRGVYFGLIGAILFFALLCFLFLRKENKKLANFCGIFFLIIVLGIVFLFSAKDTHFVRNSEFLSRITQVVDIWEIASVRERLLNWKIALEAFKEKPVFGYGPWNFGAALNKYYDWRIGKGEPWFDHPHSQPLGVLAGSGIIGFLAYLFLLGNIAFYIFKFSKKNKILSFILGAIVVGYFLQSLFLFDILPVYLGFFPLLAYFVFLNRDFYSSSNIVSQKKLSLINSYSSLILFFSALIVLLVIQFTVITPWRANNLAWEAYIRINNKLYEKAIPYLEKSFAINSPYTRWEVRAFSAKTIYDLLWGLNNTAPDKEKSEIKILYDFMKPELEKFAKNREWYPQTYFLVPTIYRLGYEKLQEKDLEMALKHLEKSFEKSSLRVEYYNNYAKILLLQGRYDEAESFYKDYVSRIPEKWGRGVAFVFLGNFYYEANKYDLAMEQYDKALQAGFRAEKEQEVYTRYMLAAEKIKDYQKIVDMGEKYLKEKGSDADTYFNIAVGYFHLGDKKKAKEFFLNALRLSQEYEKYKDFFVE